MDLQAFRSTPTVCRYSARITAQEAPSSCEPAGFAGWLQSPVCELPADWEAVSRVSWGGWGHDGGTA